MAPMKPWRPTNAEIADIIEGFLDGTCGPLDWDDFLSARIDSPYLTSVQERCDRTRDDYPPGREGGWSSEGGLRVLRRILAELRGK